MNDPLTVPARDGIEAQRGLNDIFPGDPYPVRDQLKRGLDALRAQASRGKISSADVFNLTDPLMDILARTIPAPSVAEAAEPVVIDLDAEAWSTIKEAASQSSWMPPEYFSNDWVSDVCEFLRNGHPAPSPVVPSGLEALKPVAWRVRPNPGFEWVYLAGDPERNPAIRDYERQPVYSADAIAALIAERDALAKLVDPGTTNPALVSRIIMRSIENQLAAETAERALSAALNWIAEIEGETREHEPVAYMVHNAMIVRNVNSIRQPGEIDETTVWLYPAARADHAREAAKTLRADLTPLYRKVQADDE